MHYRFLTPAICRKCGVLVFFRTEQDKHEIVVLYDMEINQKGKAVLVEHLECDTDHVGQLNLG